MDKYEVKLLMEVLLEAANANAKIDALVSMKLDIIEKEEFTVIAPGYLQERLVEFLLEYGDLLSDEDEDFLRSKFD